MLGVSARIIDRLESLGLKVVALEPKSMGDVQRVLGKVGQVLGKPDDARRIWNRIDGAIAQSAAQLPPAARAYLRSLEELAGCPISIVSTGPDRDHTMVLQDPFA